MKTRILLTAIIASCLILSSCEKGPLAGFEVYVVKPSRIKQNR